MAENPFALDLDNAIDKASAMEQQAAAREIDNAAANLASIRKSDYTSIYYLRDAFRRSGGVNDTFANGFNDTDTPTTVFFRILFNFRNGRLLDLTHNPMGILSTAHAQDDYTGKGQKAKDANWKGYTIYDTAFNYLLLNNEFERADLMEQFVNLLSNINTYSPWYFQSISGLDQAIARTELGGSEFKVAETDKILTIKCLPDAYDNRIGTLLDLYRAACFSQRLHKEIVPANLRKFDMSIYLFSTPIKNMHTHTPLGPASFEHPVNHKSYDRLDATTYKNLTSSKLIEFQDCEFDLNSSSTPFGEISNVDGSQLEYTIGIKIGQVYEQRYNEFLTRFIGDMIAWDIDHTLTSEDEKNSYVPDLLSDDDREQLSDMGYEDYHAYLEADTLTKSHFYHDTNFNVDDNNAGVGDSLGTTATTRLMQQFGMDKVADKIDSKIKDIKEKFDPKTNFNKAVNSATSLASQAINQVVSNIVFGNLFYDNNTFGEFLDKGLGGLVENATEGIRNSVTGVHRTNPTSQVGQNIYKGWTKTTTNPTSAIGQSLYNNE